MRLEAFQVLAVNRFGTGVLVFAFVVGAAGFLWGLRVEDDHASDRVLGVSSLFLGFASLALFVVVERTDRVFLIVLSIGLTNRFWVFGYKRLKAWMEGR